MKPDTYTKTILTIITVLLALIAAKPLLNPDNTVNAQTPSVVPPAPRAKSASVNAPPEPVV